MVAIALVSVFLWQREGGLAPALPILGAIGVGALRLLPALQQLYVSWTAVSANRRMTSDVVELLELPVGEHSNERAAPLAFSENIRFEEVSFAYPAARRQALREVSVSIPSGARVAVTGRPGSGKSTFADLLMGLIQPAVGMILVDGVSLTRETRRSWTRSIAHVPQSIFLADTTIARSIALGAPEEAIDRARVAIAATVAQLDEWLATLPKGLESQRRARGQHVRRAAAAARHRPGDLQGCARARAR
jgi:ABC-type multidrug transport system fused ATPase/permease subunit